MYFLISLGAIITSAILFCENNNIVVSRVKINKKVKNSIKIVQLSDLHSKEFGKDNKKLLNKVLNENPDLILLTGDLIDCTSIRYKEILVEEQGSSEAYIKRAKGEFEYKDYSIIFNEFCKLPGIKIVLSHYPENFKAIGDKSYYKYKFDLMFSGHAHGGQFRIPLIGGLYAPAQGIFPKYTAGIHKGIKNNLIISRGLGNSGFPLRLFNKPEIVVVTIENI